MIYPLAAIVVLYLILSRVDVLPRFPLRMTPGLSQKAGSIALVLLALILLLRGNVWVALALFGLALWLLGRAAKGPASGAGAHVSRVRTAMVEMDWDRRTGRMTGTVLAGPFAGRLLARLDGGQCQGVYEAAVAGDPDGARLLEAYFDRRFPGWRGAAHAHADAGARRPGPAGGMTEDEAYQVLGLRRGAARDEIVRAHRTVMKKWHPDQGGTADLAARANEAKEVLLRRHA